jgi:hypothetical protein
MQMKRTVDTQKYAGVEVKLYTCIQAGTPATMTEIYVGFFRPLGDRIPIGAKFTAPVEAEPEAHFSPFQ